MKSIVVIPARYKSSRFPGKPLAPILGKPMILWVAELSACAVGSDNVYVATDDDRIAKVVKDAGYNAIMTSNQTLTGTDRLSEVAKKIDASIYINVQGDEPLVNPSDIKKIIDLKKSNPSKVINGYCPLSDTEHPGNSNIPKVIFSKNKHLIYMSRNPLPGFKDKTNAPLKYYKQVCIYAFSRRELIEYGAYGRKSDLEKSEDIEILRFLEWGQQILMTETTPGSLAVDIPQDIDAVELSLKRSENVQN